MVYMDVMGNPVSVKGMSDRTVVLTYWGNTRYQMATSDTSFKNVPTRVSANWNKMRTMSADDVDGWRELRADFELFGFNK